LIDELAAVVPEEFIGREIASNEEVVVAVVIDIGEYTGVCLIDSVETNRSCDVNKFDFAGSITDVPVKTRTHAVREEDVLATVVVVVDRAGPTGTMFDDVKLHLRRIFFGVEFWIARVFEVDAGGF